MWTDGESGCTGATVNSYSKPVQCFYSSDYLSVNKCCNTLRPRTSSCLSPAQEPNTKSPLCSLHILVAISASLKHITQTSGCLLFVLHSLIFSLHEDFFSKGLEGTFCDTGQVNEVKQHGASICGLMTAHSVSSGWVGRMKITMVDCSTQPHPF